METTHLTCSLVDLIFGEISSVRNSLVALKFGIAGGDVGADDITLDFFSVTVDNTGGEGGGGGSGGSVDTAGGFSKKSFDASSKWFAFVTSSCARRTWSLWYDNTSVTLRPLLINGFPLNDSGNCSNKSFSIVLAVECALSVSWEIGFFVNGKCNWFTVEIDEVLLTRVVDAVSEFE